MVLYLFGDCLQEVVQGLEGLGTARDKMVVKVHQVQEFSQLTLCERQGKALDGLYLVFHRADALAVTTETKEVELSCTQDIFAGVDLKAMVLQRDKTWRR